ncbi:helix-turn-helix domain-containing protein [Pluralibacter gergoviae]|nr:helix-turn-helix domain-containing protein [Pluralibacter gergoviae]ELW9440506.1 helix-turn-helix domain-containing protein [Pluralibacter gergoviae]
MAQSDSEFSVDVGEIISLSEEGKSALTLLWVLEGTQTLEVEGESRRLDQNALHIINGHQRWTLSGSPDNVTLRLVLSAAWLCQLYPEFFSHAYAVPDESDGRLPHCDALRHLLHQLLAGTLLNHSPRYRLEATRWISEILLLLTGRFQQPPALRVRQQNPGWSRRISHVVERINTGYTRRITLAEIARAEFVSEPWLSRLFHKEVGISFMQYITRLRLEKAAAALRSSNQPLHQIAQAHGFASTRMMSDLFRRHYAMTPGKFRRQKPAAENIARPRGKRENLRPVTPDRLFHLLNTPEPQGWENYANTLNQVHERRIELDHLSGQGVRLARSGIVVTLRELDDLLRGDVRRDLDALRAEISISGIDIAEPFLSSRLFAHGWDDPQMMGYASWYNLHQIFTWLAERELSVLLHTSQTTRSDLLQRFIECACGHFPPTVTRQWDFVFHWSPQAEDTPRQAAWQSQRAMLKNMLPGSRVGIWHRFAPDAFSEKDVALLRQLPRLQADFLACSADSNELLNFAQLRHAHLAAAENYPVKRVEQIQNTLREEGRPLPLWLLSWNTLTGETRTTNGSFFRGALLMQNLLGLLTKVAVTGFWLNSSLQGETRSSGTIDTSSLALQYNHGLPRPIFWVLWLWQRLRGEIILQDRHLLFLRHQRGYQLLVHNAAIFNPWLSGEEAFLQRFRQQYLIRIAGIQGRWRVKSHLFDLRNGALFPLLQAFQAQSGPDEEVLNWVFHKARPTLSVHDEQLQAGWQASGALESNALMLYELTPVAQSAEIASTSC